MATAQATIDHDEIRQWVEARGGHPARVAATGSKNDPGILRIDFPGFSGEDSLEEIGWDEFFEWFDRNGLALLLSDEEGNRFNKLVSRAQSSGAGSRSRKRASTSVRSRGGAATTRKSGAKKAPSSSSRTASGASKKAKSSKPSSARSASSKSASSKSAKASKSAKGSKSSKSSKSSKASKSSKSSKAPSRSASSGAKKAAAKQTPSRASAKPAAKKSPSKKSSAKKAASKSAPSKKSPSRGAIAKKGSSKRSATKRSASRTGSSGKTRGSGSSVTTTNHDQIRRWVEARGGFPAHVKRTGRKRNDPGVLRIDYPGFSGTDTLERLDWEEWFDAFERNKLAFVYQDKPRSRFSKLVNR